LIAVILRALALSAVGLIAELGNKLTSDLMPVNFGELPGADEDALRVVAILKLFNFEDKLTGLGPVAMVRQLLVIGQQSLHNFLYRGIPWEKKHKIS
jgi:hypothetical protein